MIEVEGMCRLPNRDGVPRQVRVYCIPGEPDLGKNEKEKKSAGNIENDKNNKDKVKKEKEG